MIYVGAGISQSEPTHLPTGPELAGETHRRLTGVIDDVPQCDDSDLTSVADAVASPAGGVDALRQTVVGVADFTTADPNYAHRVLALLMLEGAIDVLTTNWDDCIERAGLPERVLALVSASERAEVVGPALLKLHGCATRPQTLLISTEDLENPPVWVRDEIGARLAQSDVVFVGVGGVASYVKDRLGGVIEAVGQSVRIRVVGPSIRSAWEDSGWAMIVPDLPEGNRIEMPADGFLGDLAAAYVRLFLDDVERTVRGNDHLTGALAVAAQALGQLDPVTVLSWFRATAVPRTPGKQMLGNPNAATGLVALGVLGSGLLEFVPGGGVRASGRSYQLLAAVGLQPAARLRREAENRLIAYLACGGSHDHAPTFLVSGPFLNGLGLAGLPRNVVDTGELDDVIDGPLSAEPTLLSASEVLAG